MYTLVTRSKGYLRDSMPCPACSCSLLAARCITSCRALLPRYSHLIRLCWVFSAVSPASCNKVGVVQHVSSSVILLPYRNKIHAVSLRILYSWLVKSPKFLYHTHTNRWRSPLVGQNYQI